MYYLVIILWFTLSSLAVLEYAPVCKGLKWWEQLIVAMIFIIGGPCFAISNVLTAMLDGILPEGWDDDNDFKGT